MSAIRTILMRAFGRPRGILGRLGGIVMARTNADCGIWVADLLAVRQTDKVLEVRFGPGEQFDPLNGDFACQSIQLIAVNEYGGRRR
jgi:hypothetical protein